ncbi:MAG: Holliday junction branch migration protein RuvA [Parvibaculaceae bacterium]|nr:Holliday junction branch migration protein RuvA [Parvibaculaceae bacterium]
MIGKLRGIVDSTGEDWAIVDVAGVGYLVHCSMRTLGDLHAGDPVTLFIETQVREDAITLVGFASEAERDWFRLVFTVQGVGTRVALSLLSALSPSELASALAREDKKSIERANGVGPRLASRIVTELKDKVPARLGLASALTAAPAEKSVNGSGSGAMKDAISALANLGYPSAQAAGAIAAAADKLGAEAGPEMLIRQGLKELAKS